MTLGCSAALSACGGGSQNSAPAAKPSISVPASAPATASNPDQTAPAPSASSPVAASSPQPASMPSAAPTPASAPAATPASTPVVLIDVYGDDAAMGLSGYNYGMPIIVKSAASDTQDALQKQFADTGIVITNHATGGRAASLMNLLDGMDGGGAPFAQRLASTQSSIVVISYALNDAYGGETVSNFSGYLGQAIQIVRGAGRQAVLEEPGPTCDTDHPQLAQYATAIDAVGKRYGVPVIQQYNLILGLPDWQTHMDATCVFPDAWIDAIKANQEHTVIAPLVQAVIGGQS